MPLSNQKSTAVHPELKVIERRPEKKAGKKLQRKGLVPIIVYGSKIKNLPLSIKENSAEKYSKSMFDNKIFTLLSEDKKINGMKVLKKEVSYDSLSRKPIHFDFFAPDMSQKVRITIEIKFTGKAKGVKEQGGVFNALRRNVEVECLPGEIPNFFEVNVSDLALNESFHVSDMTIPKNIKLVTKRTETLCLVSTAQEEIKQTTPEQEKEEAVSAAGEPEKTAGASPSTTAPANKKEPPAKNKK